MKEKLVRDKIPEIMVNDGATIRLRGPAVGEVNDLFRAKLLEEMEEFESTICSQDFQSKVEEAADMLQVVYSWAEANNVTFQMINAERVRKESAKGAFKKHFVKITE